MNLLKAVLYDPAAAVSKATSSLLAMTAFDTTNLRLAVTVPAHGMVRFRLQCTLEGATTFPQILLGVMNGATVLGRQAPQGAPDGTALATTFCTQWAEFVVTGLTPGAANFDAAYGVETIVAATNIKYGGPNNTTANDAFGGFAFEAWDPQPLPTAAPGAANGLFIAGTNAATTITTGLTTTFTGNLTGSVGSVTGAVGSVTAAVTLPSIPANWITAAGINASALNGKGDWMLSYTQPTGFLAATFPTGTVANTTNITSASGVSLAASQHVIVDSGTVTTLTNLPAITAGWLTATGIAAGALNGKGDWNIGKTGYSLTQTFPTNFASQVISASGVADANLTSITGTAITGAGTAVSPWKA